MTLFNQSHNIILVQGEIIDDHRCSIVQFCGLNNNNNTYFTYPLSDFRKCFLTFMMANKRSRIDLDPDYEDVTEEQSKRQRVIEQDGDRDLIKHCCG